MAINRRNTGYTTRDDGSAISARGLSAEENGKFSEGKFRSFYHVAKKDFDVLLSLGLIRSEEWHHTGARFNRRDFFEWKDSDEIDYSEMMADGRFPAGSLAEKYFTRRKAIAALVKEAEQKPWEYVREKLGFYNIPSFEEFLKNGADSSRSSYGTYTLNSNLISVAGKGIEDYLNAQDREEREREHSAISRQGDILGPASYRRDLHQEVDTKYNQIAIDRIPKEVLQQAYDNAFADDIRHNAEIEGKREQSQKANLASDGKEKVLIRIGELMGMESSEAAEVVYDASMRHLAHVENAWAVEKRQEYGRQIEAVVADIESKQKAYIERLIKQGRAERRERIENRPQMFVTEKEEMNGRYGWFTASSYYKLPRYYTGTEFKDRRGFNHYNDIRKNNSNLIEVLNDKRDFEIAAGPSEKDLKRLRMQRKEIVNTPAPSAKDALIRNELIRRMRESGIDVVTDERRAQRVLERANSSVRFSGGGQTQKIVREVLYTSYNVDDVEGLKEKYPSALPDKYYHHSTVKFGSQPIDAREGKKERLHIIGRLTTDMVDVLVVDNPESANRTPHITLATAEGVKPVASNFELEKHKDKIQPLDDYVDVTFRNNLRGGIAATPITTPDFKEWFGDWENNPEQASKVVDKEGKPLIVEHGTHADFTEFDINKLGATSRDNGLFGAGFYFGTEAPAWLNDGAADYHVMRVYLDIKHPFEMSDRVNDIYTEIKEKLDTPAMRGLTLTGLNGKKMQVGEYIDIIKSVDDLIENNPAFVNGQIAHNEDLQSYHPKEHLRIWREREISRLSGMGVIPGVWQSVIAELIGSQQFTAAAIQDGYDGVIVDRGEGYKEYVAFEPNQIKSATENIGTYRRDSNDIRFQKVEENTIAPVFISNAMIALDKIRQEKATPEQWLKMLEKNGGIKAGEDRWTGLTEWLRSKNDIKEEQLKLILNSNPHDDSIGFEHTWIRQKEDIKTFEESFGEDYDIHESQAPDYTAEMISSALKSEKITVYSSHPIEDGAFVTPSKMEAQNYAGGGQVYSKEINLKDVAWIDPMQGQYAPIKSISLTKSEIVDYLKENMIEVEEVHYQSESSYYDSQSFKELNKEFNDIRANIVEVRQERWNEADEIYASFMSDMRDKYGEEWSSMMNNDEIRKEGILLERRDEYGEDVDYDIDEAAFEEMVNRYGDDFSIAFSEWDSSLQISDADYAASFLELEKEINRTREQYTTAGLKNNREIALVVPTIESWNEYDEIHFGDAGDGRAIAWVRFGETTFYNRREKSEQEIEEEKEVVRKSIPAADKWHKWGKEDGYRDILYTYYEGKPNRTYIVDKSEVAKQRGIENGFGLFVAGKLISQHKTLEDAVEAFKEYRALQEVAPFESTPQKVLVIDEIQSKRHQEGREKGYRRGIRAERDAVAKIWSDSGRTDDNAYKRLQALNQELRNWEEHEQWKDNNAWRIPDAPFDKNWQELCMKRMLRYAAENGYDRVAWTTGEQQAERYDLSNKINFISYDRGNRTLLAGTLVDGSIDYNQYNIEETHVAPEDLHKFIGKELAPKVLEKGILQGEDLRVGGEGMKAFYDNILVKFTEKYTKKWGAKTEDVELPEIGETMHSVPVTEQMRSDVMQGQPMFFKTQTGEAYGFAYDNKIYVDTKIATAETPIHEYAHLWAEVLRENNPREWKNIVSLMKGATDVWQKVERQYPELHSDDEIADEVLAQYSGKRGYERLMQEHSSGEVSKDAFDRLTEALERLWKKVAEFFRIHYTTKEEVADRILKDLLSGVNPRQEVEKFLKKQDREYMRAVEQGDEKKVQKLFQSALMFSVGNGMTPYIAAGGYRGKMAPLARKVKTMDKTAINRAAETMAPLIPKNAVLVPAPSHKGEATDMLMLAKAIARQRNYDVKVMDVLKSYERERQYISKKVGGKAIDANDMGIVAIKDIPEGKIPVIIDNVVSTGNTAEACVKALGYGVVVSLADATTAYKHTASLKSAAPVMRNQAGQVIPLSKRFDLSGARYIAHAAALQKVDDINHMVNNDEPLKSLAEVRNFMEKIGYKGNLSKVMTNEDGKKFVKFYANGSVTPNIYLGETTKRDIYRQFHLYGNTMDVNIPADMQAEFERDDAERKAISDNIYADEREEIKAFLTNTGVPFVDVIDCERGSRIVFTDKKNDNGNYTDWLDVADPQQAREDIDYIRQKAENYKLNEEMGKENQNIQQVPNYALEAVEPYKIHIGTDNRHIVEGEFHVQFTDASIKLNFDVMERVAKEHGGTMRMMDGKPWFDFYDKGSAEKFAEQITSIGKNITNTINSKEMEKQNENKAGREPMKKIEVLKWAVNHIGANHGSKALEINFEPDYYGITIGNNVPALADVQKMCDDLGISRESVQSKGHTIQVQLPKDWPDTIGQEQYIPTGNEMWKRANKEIGSHLGYFVEGYDPVYERGVGKTVFFDDLQKAKDFCDKESQRAKTGVWHEVYEVAHETRTPALYVSSWDNKENKVVDITSNVYKYEESNDKNLNDSILRPDLIKRVGELGIDYTPVGLSKGINIEVENEDGEKKPMTVKFASVSDKDILLFDNVYDVFDDSKGVSIDELPEYKKATIFESLRATLANGGEKQIVIVQDKAEVPSYALPAIINGDFCGIDNEQDEKDIRAFMDKNAGCIYDIQPGSGCFIPFPVFGKGADCETVFIVKPTTPEKLLEETKKLNENLPFPEIEKGKEVEAIMNDIKPKFEAFKEANGNYPLYAEVEILFKGEKATEHQIIKLSEDIDERDDEKVFYNVNGLEGLCELIHKGDDFKIVNKNNIDFLPADLFISETDKRENSINLNKDKNMEQNTAELSSEENIASYTRQQQKLENQTSALKQFYDFKAKRPDTILLFRTGDFYEVYGEDVPKAAEILGITATKHIELKEKDGQPLRQAMFPHHALDTYLPKLIRAGHRVAICEPSVKVEKKKGITATAAAQEKQPAQVSEERKDGELRSTALFKDKKGVWNLAIVTTKGDEFMRQIIHPKEEDVKAFLKEAKGKTKAEVEQLRNALAEKYLAALDEGKAKAVESSAVKEESAEAKYIKSYADLMIAKIEEMQAAKENGNGKEWKKPWFGVTALPRSINGTSYLGMNNLILQLYSEKQGYTVPVFATFRRFEEMNYTEDKSGKRQPAKDKEGNILPRVHVLKGQSSFPVKFNNVTFVNDKTGEKLSYKKFRELSEEEREEYSVKRTSGWHHVFCVEQTNLKEARPDLYAKLAEPYKMKNVTKEGQVMDFIPVDMMISDDLWICPINIQEGGDRAFFSPGQNAITFPAKTQFYEDEEYYSNLFHEMAHSTGVAPLHNRLKPTALFGTPDYAEEELVAELTAAVVASQQGMTKEIKEESALYLASWLDAIKEQPSYLANVLHDVDKASATINTRIADVEEQISLGLGADYSKIHEYNDELRSKVSGNVSIEAATENPTENVSIEETQAQDEVIAEENQEERTGGMKL